MSDVYAENHQNDQPHGNHCRRCGDFIDGDRLHSFCIGPRAGHYCFGCEPAGIDRLAHELVALVLIIFGPTIFAAALAALALLAEEAEKN